VAGGIFITRISAPETLLGSIAGENKGFWMIIAFVLSISNGSKYWKNLADELIKILLLLSVVFLLHTLFLDLLLQGVGKVSVTKLMPEAALGDQKYFSKVVLNFF